MAEPIAVARPYAEAAFKLAAEKGALVQWSDMLASLAAVASDERVREAIRNPNLPEAKRAGLFLSILSGKLTGDAENLVRVLAENDRLALLPEIRDQFVALRHVHEGIVEVDVYSAFELSADQVGDLVQRLEKKTGRKVRAKVAVDASLIGGIKVVIGDKVIDGSARAQLAALETALKT